MSELLPRSIVADGVELRLPRASDADALHQIFSTQQDYLGRWLEWPARMQTRADAEAYVAARLESRADGVAWPFMIIEGGDPVGICELYIENEIVRIAEISYWISREAQGRGLVTRSCRLLLAFGFEELALNRVVLRYKRELGGQENAGSRKVAERLGFVFEGVQREGGLTRGEYMDMVCYSMLAREWSSNSEQ